MFNGAQFSDHELENDWALPREHSRKMPCHCRTGRLSSWGSFGRSLSCVCNPTVRKLVNNIIPHPEELSKNFIRARSNSVVVHLVRACVS